MIVLGLTGSIGMGKSTAARIFGVMGVPVHDADAAVHEVLGAGGEAVPLVAETFPGSIDAASGAVDRHRLGLMVFADPDKRKTLELILHPLVRRRQKRFLLACRAAGAKIAVLDVPLLFETGVYRSCDYTICVSAPYFVQRQRVLSRPGMTEEKFHERLDSQLPNSRKCRLADFVVHTGLGKAHVYRQLSSVTGRILEGKKKPCVK